MEATATPGTKGDDDDGFLQVFHDMQYLNVDLTRYPHILTTDNIPDSART